MQKNDKLFSFIEEVKRIVAVLWLTNGILAN